MIPISLGNYIWDKPKKWCKYFHFSSSGIKTIKNEFSIFIGICTARQLCGITPTNASVFLHSQWKSVLISSVCPVQISRDLPQPPYKSSQSQRRFCPVPIGLFSRRVDFSSCSKRQYVAFVSNTFSSVLSLYINYNIKTKWQSCQPILHLDLLTSLFGCLAVDCLRGRYWGT